MAKKQPIKKAAKPSKAQKPPKKAKGAKASASPKKAKTRKEDVHKQSVTILRLLREKGPIDSHEIHKELAKAHGAALPKPALDKHLNELAQSGVVSFTAPECDELHEVCQSLTKGSPNWMSPTDVQKGVKCCKIPLYSVTGNLNILYHDTKADRDDNGPLYRKIPDTGCP